MKLILVIDNLSDIVFNTNGLSIFHCNVRSINLHFNEFLVYLNSIPHTFDLIILTETWLSVNLNFNINVYKTYHSLGFLNKSDEIILAINNFLMGIDSYLSDISINDKVIICGDMSINILDKSSEVSNYLNITASYNFISCIDSYTRVTETSMSCIDHIFIRNIDISKPNSFVIKTDITSLKAKEPNSSKISKTESETVNNTLRQGLKTYNT
ncbi:Uncharacterized protein FWK35_00028895 [Aphis craccivora]|uniref:Uncharacterized protein n=1 Tax=Aphis craccivora TaxID=307492 RepID=A0A6G0VPD0_APHCR|nr:Uncharacterized protein FWK35_00028895 [Aphis craccivora]